LRHGSLFSGIGGFDLAAEWMGWENVFNCEWNTFGQKILKYYWPNAIGYEDITKTDFSVHRGNIDIISGGFPCQAFSTAGSRKGTADPRYLWPEMLRVIREICPRWVVGENVYGLVNWNGGLVFDTVCADLENEGFQVIPIILPAASVNAPHKRDRIFFIAYAWACEHRGKSTEIHGKTKKTDGCGNEQSPSPWKQIQLPTITSNTFRGFQQSWKSFPIEHPLCRRDDGLPAQLDGITFSKWRNESIKGFGNAVVPQLVFQIFKTIELYEQQ
jgi:DNA (cytosine-5)-methyltransferase 1